MSEFDQGSGRKGVRREVIRLEKLPGFEGVRDAPLWPPLTLYSLLHMPGRYWGMLLTVFLIGYGAYPIVGPIWEFIKSLK